MGTTEERDGEVVKVSTHGQATIPKAFREKLGIDAPGRVRFVENDRGEVVVERVPSPDEMRGIASDDAETTEQSATAMLREKRAADKRRREDTDGA